MQCVINKIIIAKMIDNSGIVYIDACQLCLLHVTYFFHVSFDSSVGRCLELRVIIIHEH